MAELEEKAETLPTPSARDLWTERYRSANPDAGDPDDDAIFAFADQQYGDTDKKYKDLNSANERLASLVAKDPRLAAVLSMIASEDGKSLPYAIANVYGKDFLNLEGADLDDFEAGYQENLKRLAESEELQKQAAKNIEDYQATIEQFGKDKNLTGEQLDEVHSGIMQFAENMLMGIVPVDLIDLVYKGLNYDKDVQEAADTGFVEGKNEVADIKMKAKTQMGAVPDLSGGSGAGKNKPTPKHKRGSFFEGMTEEKV